MEFSTWFEVMTHPVTGERTTVRADTVEELDRQIAAWKTSIQPGRTPEHHGAKGA